MSCPTVDYIRTPQKHHAAPLPVQSCFSLGLREAANKLGVCATTLKRHCRKHNIWKWPNRELKKYNRVCACGQCCGSAVAELLTYAHTVVGVLRTNAWVRRPCSAHLCNNNVVCLLGNGRDPATA